MILQSLPLTTQHGFCMQAASVDLVDSEDEVSNTNNFDEIDDDDDFNDEVVAAAPKRGAAGRGRTTASATGVRASRAGGTTKSGGKVGAAEGRGEGRRASARAGARGRVRYDNQDDDGDSSEVRREVRPCVYLLRGFRSPFVFKT